MSNTFDAQNQMQQSMLRGTPYTPAMAAKANAAGGYVAGGRTPGGYVPPRPADPPSSGGGGSFDPMSFIEGMPEAAAFGVQGQQNAQTLANYIQGLPLGQAEKVMGQLTAKGSPLQGTQMATDLYNILNGQGTGGATGATTSSQGFDPFGLTQAFQTTIPNWLTGQEKQGAAINAAGQATMNAALKGASPQIQAAYGAIMPGMEQAQNAETQTMANLALATPQFNEMIAGIQALNQAYTQAKAAATNEPYVAATVQGTALPGAQSQANALTAGLQGPGIPTGSTPGPTGNVPSTNVSGTNVPTTNPAALAGNPAAYAAALAALQQQGQAIG